MSNEASLVIMAQTIQDLTQALKQSDLRQRRTERTLRWGSACFLLMVSIGLYLGVDLSTRAYAESTLHKELRETEQLLQNLNTIVAGFAQQMAQEDSPTRQFLSDVSTLTTRFKEDSDFLRSEERKMMGGMTALHQDVVNELKLLNGALASMPIITVEMQKMSANMASMSYSVGSTMGRMGNMMPW